MVEYKSYPSDTLLPSMSLEEIQYESETPEAQKAFADMLLQGVGTELKNQPTLAKVYNAIFNSVKEISMHLRYSTVNRLGKKNEFGDEKLDMDVATDNLVRDNLKKCKGVLMCLSEERPYPMTLSKNGEYIVTFDPIDGGSHIESNYTIGTIFGVWPRGDINGMTGRNMVTAVLAVYGSRTTVIFFNTNSGRVEEYTLRINEDETCFWEKTKEKIKIAKTTRIFSPANSRAILDNIAYRQVLELWTKAGYALRYSGSLSADIYHMLVKGEGVYCSIGSKLQKKKLRILYEQKAGGLSSNGEISLLDVVVEGYYQKTDFIVGSKEEVQRVQRYVTADKMKKKAQSQVPGQVGEQEASTPSATEKKYRIQKQVDETNDQDDISGEFF